MPHVIMLSDGQKRNVLLFFDVKWASGTYLEYISLKKVCEIKQFLTIILP